MFGPCSAYSARGGETNELEFCDHPHLVVMQIIQRGGIAQADTAAPLQERRVRQPLVVTGIKITLHVPVCYQNLMQRTACFAS